MESEQQCQVRTRSIIVFYISLILTHHFAYRTFALPLLGVAITHSTVTAIGAFFLKIVMHRFHAMTVLVVNLAATQMTSHLPQLQRAMMKVFHKVTSSEGK